MLALPSTVSRNLVDRLATSGTCTRLVLGLTEWTARRPCISTSLMELGRGFPTPLPPFPTLQLIPLTRRPGIATQIVFEGKTISAYRVSLLRGWFRLNPRLGECNLFFGGGRGIPVRRNGFPPRWKFMEVNLRIEGWRDWILLGGGKGNSSVREREKRRNR